MRCGELEVSANDLTCTVKKKNSFDVERSVLLPDRRRLLFRCGQVSKRTCVTLIAYTNAACHWGSFEDRVTQCKEKTFRLSVV